MYESNRIKLPISSRYVAMGCGRGLLPYHASFRRAVAYRSGVAVDKLGRYEPSFNGGVAR